MTKNNNFFCFLCFLVDFLAVSLLAAVAVVAVDVAVVQTVAVAVAVVAAAVAVAVAALSLVGSEYFPSWQLYLLLVVGGTGSVC